jgi:hypothetical protein
VGIGVKTKYILVVLIISNLHPDKKFIEKIGPPNKAELNPD